MSSSLQDQLVKAGLVSEDRAKKLSEKPRRRGGKHHGKAHGQGRKKKGSRARKKGGSSDLAKAYAIRAQTERREREEEAARRKAEAQRRKQAKAALKKIINEHKLNDEKAEVPRNFEYRGRIKRIYVTPKQQQALTEEELGIAMVAGRSFLLPLEAMAEVEKVQAEAVAWPRPEGEKGDQDDEDGDHKVPDDLMW